jgi:hypothetical protein
MLFLPVSAFADYDVKPVLAQKQKIDEEIVKRNRLLGNIGIPPNPMFPDSTTLTSFNESELNIEYLLDSLASFLRMLNNIEKVKNPELSKELIENFRKSSVNSCWNNHSQMMFLKLETINPSIRNELDLQLKNAENACYILGGAIQINNKIGVIY